MIGTSTPRSRTLADHLRDRGRGLLGVDRDADELASRRGRARATWIAVASASAVSVFVIDWTTIGWALPDEDAADVDADRRPPPRPEWRLRHGAPSVPPVEAADDVEAGHPDDEREQEHHADDVRQLLRTEADPLAEEPLERDHQHPAAIERRERQDVDEREVGRQDAGDVQREDRAGVPEDVADLGRDADRSGDRRRRVGSAATS